MNALRTHLRGKSAQALADAVTAAVSDGSLARGQKLEPIRKIAGTLGFSPTTVSAAWSLLRRSGLLRTDGRRGSFIREVTGPGPWRYRRALQRTTAFELDLSAGVADPGLLPDLSVALRRLPAALPTGTYLDPPVLPPLLDLLHRQWAYEVDSIAIVDGAMDAHDLAVATHLRLEDRVAVENPCFPPLLDLLEAAGVEVVPIAIDDDGPVPEAVAAAVATGLRALLIQPRAQNPTGASITAERADQLAQILKDTDILVVENDSAGDVASSPLVSLAPLLDGRVIHIHSYSKSHGPDLRLAAVGGPAHLIDPITERRMLGQGWTSRMLQQLLLDLLTDDDAIRLVAASRKEYEHRRTALVGALAERDLPVSVRDGLNVWVPVFDEAGALVHLASRGIGAAAGRPFFVAGGKPHLRITAGVVATGHAQLAEEIAAAALSHVWPTAR